MSHTTSEALRKTDLWKVGLGCLVLTAALYYPALRFAFVGDDVWFVRPNPHWLRDAILPSREYHYYPLNQIMIYGLTALSGWRPSVMHTLNLLLHAGIGFGLCLWLSRMGAVRWVCLIAPLFFIARGINYEVVTWVTELSYLAVVVYTLLTFFWWDRYLRGQGDRYLAGTVAAFTAALLTMEHAVVLPPLYFLYELLVRPEQSIRSHLPLPPDPAGNWWRPYVLRLLKDLRRYLPFLLVTVGFLGAKYAQLGGLTWSSVSSPPAAFSTAPMPSGEELTQQLPADRSWHGTLNTPRRAYLDLLVSSSYLFFPTIGCHGADDTWLSRRPWLFLLPWLLVHVWAAWKGRPLTRFLLLWVYVYMLPLAVAGVPQARYYYMATLPAAALMSLAVVTGWDWLRRRVRVRLGALAWFLLALVTYGEGVFIRARLEEWKLASDLMRRTLAFLEQDLNGPVEEVYLVNFPRVVPSPFFPADGFANAVDYLHLMLRPPREDVKMRAVYDRSLVGGRWPTLGEYASPEEVRKELESSRRIAYRFVDHPPWITRWR